MLDVLLAVPELVDAAVPVMPEELSVPMDLVIEAGPVVGLFDGEPMSETLTRHASMTAMTTAALAVLAMPARLRHSCTRQRPVSLLFSPWHLSLTHT